VVVVVVGSAEFVVAAAGSGLATVGVPVAELAAVVTTVDSVVAARFVGSVAAFAANFAVVVVHVAAAVLVTPCFVDSAAVVVAVAVVVGFVAAGVAVADFAAPAVRAAAAAGSVADWFSGNDEVVVVAGLTGCWAGWRRSEELDRPHHHRPQPSDPWH